MNFTCSHTAYTCRLHFFCVKQLLWERYHPPKIRCVSQSLAPSFAKTSMVCTKQSVRQKFPSVGPHHFTGVSHFVRRQTFRQRTLANVLKNVGVSFFFVIDFEVWRKREPTKSYIVRWLDLSWLSIDRVLARAKMAWTDTTQKHKNKFASANAIK